MDKEFTRSRRNHYHEQGMHFAFTDWLIERTHICKKWNDDWHGKAFCTSMFDWHGKSLSLGHLGASYRVFPNCMKLGVKCFSLFTLCRQENAIISPYIHMTWKDPWRSSLYGDVFGTWLILRAQTNLRLRFRSSFSEVQSVYKNRDRSRDELR